MRSSAEAAEDVKKAYRLDARFEYLLGNLSEARKIVLRGGSYYKGSPFFLQLRTVILGGN